jgi:hypothetical protein
VDLAGPGLHREDRLRLAAVGIQGDARPDRQVGRDLEEVRPGAVTVRGAVLVQGGVADRLVGALDLKALEPQPLVELRQAQHLARVHWAVAPLGLGLEPLEQRLVGADLRLLQRQQPGPGLGLRRRQRLRTR